MHPFFTGKGQSLVKNLPFNRILSETDGPFCQEDGRIIYPQDVHIVNQSIANIRGIEQSLVTEKIKSNLLELLS